MKIMKPLIITQLSENRYEYSSGYDHFIVEVDRDKTANCYDGRKVFAVTHSGGPTMQFTMTDSELYGMLERRLLYPNPERYSLAEFDQACDKSGHLSGVVQLSLATINNAPLEMTLVHALVDLGTLSYRYAEVVNYEVIGCEEHTIIVMVTLKRDDDVIRRAATAATLHALDTSKPNSSKP